MKKADYSAERLAGFLENVSVQYGSEIEDKCRQKIDSLRPEDDVRPLQILHDVKQAVSYSESRSISHCTDLRFCS